MKRSSKMKHIGVPFFVAVLATMTCASGWAQGTAQISGVIQDQTGALIPGGEVTATQTATAAQRIAVSNETGSYVLPNLPVGPYSLEVALPGFRTYIQTGIVLEVSSSPVINVTLVVGQVDQTVEVVANAVQVETRTTAIGQVVDSERILELPLDGRNVTQLILLAGSAVESGSSRSFTIRNVPAISVAGSFQSATAYILDGALHNNPYDNLSLPLPFPDALQEFQVQTSVRSAQSGLHAGAEVNAVTRSGTNEVHGSGFWFVRNDLFNARNYFARENSTLKRNQFGGTLGGPIARNKLFVFGGYQGETIRQDPSDNRAFVPTPAMLAGDFTDFASPACNAGRQITLDAPFVNNRIDPALMSPAAVTLSGMMPETGDPCGEVRYASRAVDDSNQFVGRVDYQLSNAQSLFGRYLATGALSPSPYEFDPVLMNTTTTTHDSLAQSWALGHTWVINPDTVNALRLSVNRSVADRPPVEFISAPELGINITPLGPRLFRVGASGAFQAGVWHGTNRTMNYQLGQDLNLTRGNHQWAFGANLQHQRVNFNDVVVTWGDFSFDGQATGLSLADFLTGQPSRFRQVGGVNQNYGSQWILGVYLADTWRVAPRLTFNYGVRWEPYWPTLQRHGEIANFSEERYAAGLQSTAFKNAPAGMTYPGDPGFAGECDASGKCSGTGIHADWGTFNPRVGLAWDPLGDGRTSIRAAYGMAYDQLTGGFFSGFYTAPWATRIIVQSPASFEDPWRDYPGGNPFPQAAVNENAVFPPFASITGIREESSPTTRHSWNLSIQRELTDDVKISATYMGSQTHHIWWQRDENTGVFIPGEFDAGGNCALDGRIVLTGGTPGRDCSTRGNLLSRLRLGLEYPEVGGTRVGGISHWEPGGTQSYHGLLVSVERRAARGVNINANYTWSHCYGHDTTQSGHGGGAFRGGPDPLDYSLERGNCSQDRRHILNITGVAEMPQFANPTMRAIASGWRLAGIHRASTGSWMTITSGVDRTLSGLNRTQRPNQIRDNVYGDRSAGPLSRYLDPAAFELPPLGSNGNMRRANVEGPGTWQFDLSLTRGFEVTETQTLEFRAEMYNVTNSFRPVNPETNLRSSTFGVIRNSRDPRIMQFALKYIF